MSDVNLSISQEVVQPIIEAKIHAAVCEALSGSQQIVSDVVTRVLNTTVNSDGKPSTYRSDIPYIQWLCTKAIRNAATEAVRRYVDSANERLVVEIEKAMQKRSKAFAVNLVQSLIESTKSSWRLKVDVAAEEIKDSY